MSALQNERIHALDAVRGGALLLGIFFHGMISFVPIDYIWLIKDNASDAFFSGGFYVLHIFRMTLFFMIAGYFGRMAYHRKGPLKFILDRIKRIAAPLVIFWPLMMMAFTGLIIWSILQQNGGVMPEDLPPPPPITLETFPLTHLWFLYILLILYVGMLLSRSIISLLDRKYYLRSAIDQLLEFLIRRHIILALLALPAAYMLTTLPNWMIYFGIPSPDHGLVPNFAALTAFGVAFIFGWNFQRQEKLLLELKKTWVSYFVIAVGLTGFCYWQTGMEASFTTAPINVSVPIYAFALILASWSWTFMLIGLALNIFAKHNKAIRYIADASYWLYLIHLPLVIALQIWVSSWPWSAFAKYAFIMGLCMPLMLLSYHFVVRRTFIGGLLNGRRYNLSGN